jgi:hypothetical protein
VSDPVTRRSARRVAAGLATPINRDPRPAEERGVVKSPSPQDLLREFARLNARRKDAGVTPLELQRWLDLRQKLEKAFPGRPPPGGGVTRVRVEFETRRRLSQAIMAEVRPIGLFLPTPFTCDPGTRFDLRVFVEETGDSYQGPVVVVSNNVGPGYSTGALGMGVRFDAPDCSLRRALDELFEPR